MATFSKIGDLALARLFTVTSVLVVFAGAANAAGLVFIPPLETVTPYPNRAWHEGIEGRAIVACTLRDGGELTDCAVKVEEPQGYGFGEAALAAAAATRIDIAASDAAGSVGQRIAVPLVFKLDGVPKPVDPSPAS